MLSNETIFIIFLISLIIIANICNINKIEPFKHEATIMDL